MTFLISAFISHNLCFQIYTHKRITNTQILAKSSNITKVIIEYLKHLIVLISIYISYNTTVSKNKAHLKTRLWLIKFIHYYMKQLQN